MDAATLMGLVGTGPNAAVVASLGGDPTWNVAEDWGLEGWRVERVPAGIKFRHAPHGLVREEVLVVRTGGAERVPYTRLAALARVPVHVAFVEQSEQPRNRLTSRSPFPGAGCDQ